jgi:hypothetical protein
MGNNILLAGGSLSMFNRGILALLVPALAALALVPATAAAHQVSSIRGAFVLTVVVRMPAPNLVAKAARLPLRIRMQNQTRAETDHTCQVAAIQATKDYIHRFGRGRHFHGHVVCQHPIAYPCIRDHTRWRIFLCHATYQLHWQGGPWDGTVLEYRKNFNYRWIGRRFWQPKKYREPWYTVIINS